MNRLNSRARGQRGELLWRDVVRSYGLTAERGQQRAGGPESPDVKCEEMDQWFHCEVKFSANLSLPAAIRQAQEDCADDHRIWYVAHKMVRERWLCTIGSEHYALLLRYYFGTDDRVSPGQRSTLFTESVHNVLGLSSLRPALDAMATTKHKVLCHKSNDEYVCTMEVETFFAIALHYLTHE